jgi:NAD(P)-dependent dehydrogenase (short-subunit alcohol dehydrogenase family)
VTRLEGRHALVTGAGSGLGRVIAERFAAEGARLTLVGRREEAVRDAAAALTATGASALAVSADVRRPDDVARCVTAAEDALGPVDVLVNNAGIVGPRGPLEDTTAAAVLATLDTNLLGVVRVTRAFLPLLRIAANPRIVNVSSNTGRLTWQHENGWPQERAPAVYSTSKAALTMLTLEYAQSLPGILVNVAFPGYTATDLNDGQGTQTLAEGTDAIVRLATLPPGGPTGTTQLREGVTTPW